MRDVNEGKRGGKANAAGLSFLWADIDCSEGKHAAEKLPKLEEAAEFLVDLPTPPNVVVFTGGGFHAYWVLRDLVRLQDDGTRDDAEELVRGWQTFLRRRFAERGWHLDDTAHLSRSLRAPGVLNGKYGRALLPQVIFDDGVHTDVADFEEYRDLGRSRHRPPRAPRTNTRFSKNGVRVPAAPAHVEFAVQALCASNGLQRVEKRDCDGMLVAIVLDLCPSCWGEETGGGTASGTAHVTALSGRLKCKRDSCGASGDGYALHEWTPWLPPADLQRFRELEEAHGGKLPQGSRVSGPPIAPEGARTVRLEECDNGALYELFDKAARHSIAKSRWPPRRSKRIAPQPGREFIASLLYAPLGAGKTTIIAKWVSRHPNCAVFLRNHDVLEEFAARLDELGVPYVVYMGPERACQYPDAVEKYEGWVFFRERICKGCPFKDDSSCAAWPHIPRQTVLLATHAAFWTLEAGWKWDPESRRPFKPLNRRLCIFDESPPSIDDERLSDRELLEPLTHLHDFVSPDAVRTVCRIFERLFDRIRRERNRSDEGKHPTYYHGGELVRFVRQAVGPLFERDHLAVAQAEVRILRELWANEDFWKPLSDDASDRCDRELKRLRRRAQRTIRKLQAEVKTCKTPRLSPFRSLQQLGHASMDKEDDGATPDELRAATVDPCILPDPRLVQAWGALLALVTPSNEEGADRLGECGFLEVAASDRRIDVVLNRITPLWTNQLSGIVVVDATAPLELARLRESNPSIRFAEFGLDVEADSQWTRWRYCLHTSSTNRGTLLRNRIVTQRTLSTLEGVLRRTGELAAETLGQGPHSLGLISHSTLVRYLWDHPESLRQRLPDNIRIRPEHMKYYGHGERGSNAFEGCDGLILLGAPFPNLGDARAESRALELEPDEYVWHKMQSGLIQSAGRLRSLRAPRDHLTIVAAAVIPDGGEEWELVYPEKGRRASRARDVVFQTVHEALSAGEVIAAWLLQRLLVSASSAPKRLTETLEGSFGALAAARWADRLALIRRSGALPKRNLQRWIREAPKPSGAVLQRIKSLPRGRLVWRPEGLDPAEAEKQALALWKALSKISGGRARRT